MHACYGQRCSARGRPLQLPSLHGMGGKAGMHASSGWNNNATPLALATYLPAYLPTPMHTRLPNATHVCQSVQANDAAKQQQQRLADATPRSSHHTELGNGSTTVCRTYAQVGSCASA